MHSVPFMVPPLLAVSIFAYGTLLITIGVFVVMLLWVIRPDGIPLLSLLSPRERGLRKARTLLAAGDWKTAFAIADSLRDPLEPDPPFDRRVQYFEGDCLYQAAERALQNSKYAEALELMRGAGDRLGLPEVEFDKRIVGLLLAELRRRVSSDPASIEIERLVAELQRVSAAHPEAAFWLGLHHLHAKKYEQAVNAFQDALADEQVPDAAIYLGALNIQADQPREALRWLGQAARQAPDNPVVQWQLGDAILESSGDPAAAVKALERATGPAGLMKYVSDPNGMWIETLPPESWLAQLTRRMPVPCPLGFDRPDQALSSARRSLATALERCNRSTDAATVYYQAFSSGDDSPLVRRGLGLSLARAGLYDDALPHLKAAQAQESPPTPLTTGYLAVCTARATSTTPEEHAKNLLQGIDVLTGLEVRGDAEWARLARELYREVETAGVKLTSIQFRELSQILASVGATDATAIEVYDQLAEEPDQVPADVAALYVRAATDRNYKGLHDAAMFDRAFRDRDSLRRFFAERKWDFTTAERAYLTRWVERSPGRYPESPGPIYAAVAERMLIDESRQAQVEGHYDTARTLSELAFTLGPTRALTLDRMAEMAFRQDDRAEALRLLGEWTKNHPADPRPLVRRALIELQDGNVDSALELLAEACDKVSGPGRGKLYLVTARVALTAGHNEIAEELLEQARTAIPTDPDPLLALVALAWKRGDYDRVASFAVLLERLRGDDAQRSYFAALAHSIAGNETSAEAAFATASSTDNWKNDTAHLRATMLVWQGRDAEALESLQSVRGDSGLSIDLIRGWTGQLAWNRGEYSAAWKAWDALPAERRSQWKLEAAFNTATYLAGLQAMEAGQADDALRLFRQARNAGFSHPNLAAMESIVWQRATNNAAQANDDSSIEQLKRFEQSISSESMTPSQAAWLARGYRHHGAKVDADRLIKHLDLTEFHVCMQRGLLDLANGDLKSAESAFAAAQTIAPDAQSAIHNLFFTRLSMGRLDELATLIGKAIESAPTPEGQRVLSLMRGLIANQSSDPILQTMTPADEQRLHKRLQHLGRLDAAQKLLDRLITVRPASPIFLQAKSDLLVLAVKQAIECGDAAAALAVETEATPSRAVRNLRGVAATILGNFAEALIEFQAALPPKGDDARVQQNLALTLTRLGQPHQSAGHWQKYLGAYAAHCPVPPNSTDYLFRLGGLVRQRLAMEPAR